MAGTSEKGLEQFLAKTKEGCGDRLVGGAMEPAKRRKFRGRAGLLRFQERIGRKPGQEGRTPSGSYGRTDSPCARKRRGLASKELPRDSRSLRQIFSSGPGKRSQDLSGRWRIGGGCRHGDAAGH